MAKTSMCRKNVCNLCNDYAINFANQTWPKAVLTLSKFWAKMSATSRHDNATLLALATLGDTTQIGSFLFVSQHQRWQRQEVVAKMLVSYNAIMP